MLWVQYFGGVRSIQRSSLFLASPVHQLPWYWLCSINGPLFSREWASCQIRKIAGARAPGMPRTFSSSPQVSDPDMHHGPCVTHVPWCMPGSLTSGFFWNWRRGKTFPAFPVHAQPAIFRIWLEPHGSDYGVGQLLGPPHCREVIHNDTLGFQQEMQCLNL